MLTFFKKKMKSKSTWKGRKAEDCMVEVIEMIDDDVYNVKAKIELDNIYKELD